MKEVFRKTKFFTLILCLILFGLVTFSSQQNTSNPTVVAPNTDIGPCTCDLTANVCDVSCCCDSDCSATDRAVFTTCVDSYSFADSQSCFPTSLFFRNNTPYKVNTASSNLFCIYNDNYQTRNFYTVPMLVTTVANISSLLKIYHTYGFTPNVYDYTYTNPASFTNYYKANDPVYVYFNTTNTIGKLTLPYAQAAAGCTSDNPVLFLSDRSSTCARTVSSLNTSCTTTIAYNTESFTRGFRVVFNPSAFKEVINYTVEGTNTSLGVNYSSSNLIPIQITATCVDANGNTIDCNTTSVVPEYNDTTQECSKMLKSITYNVKYSGTSGIKSIEAVTVLTSLSTSATSLLQTFAVKFLQDGKTAGVPRSGNPGYLVGKPVMGGRWNDTTKKLLVSNDPTQWVTVPSGGDCINPVRSSVQFGIATSSGCLLTIQKEITDGRCKEYQQIIYNALLGQFPSNRIATFGNSLSSKPGDWVTINGQTTDVIPTSGSGICNQMITGARLSIIYARVGSLVNPQNKIIGASMSYVRGSIAYSCTEFSCLPGAEAASQTVPISMDVTFVDASTTPVAQEKDKPVFLARLPYDFFYPFYVENSAPSVATSTLLSMACGLTALLIASF